MSRTTIEELKTRNLGRMSAAERGDFDQAYASARLAMSVGEKVRETRQAAGLTQRELARRMATSQAAVARLEAGGVASTLATLQRVATALDVEIAVTLGAAS